LPAGDVVYVVSRAGVVICVARESGQIYWMRDLNPSVVDKKNRPKKQGGFLGIGGKVVAKPVWSGPLLANNRLILVGSSGQLISMNAKTGEVERRVNLGSRALMSPISVGKMIYVVTDTGELIALR
jgi:outer membrane protein assembly factor BamB